MEVAAALACGLREKIKCNLLRDRASAVVFKLPAICSELCSKSNVTSQKNKHLKRWDKVTWRADLALRAATTAALSDRIRIHWPFH